MLIGYARVSSHDQNLGLQEDALRKAGCERVFTDKATGSTTDRPGFRSALEQLRAGDVFIVWKLDRVGRSVRHLVEFAADLVERGAELRSLTDAIDTTTPAGKFFFHVMSALAEMERALIVERTQAGLAAARARGREGGRPPKLSKSQVAAARELVEAGRPLVEVAEVFGVHRATLYRRLRRK